MKARFCLKQIKDLPLCPPPFFAIFRYSVSVTAANNFAEFGDLGLEQTVTISENNNQKINK